MNKVLTVRFMTTQNAEDLYRNIETGRVYARQPTNCDDLVFWTTTSKWSGGYEADCPIREGITMRVVDKPEKTVLFEEVLCEDTWNGGTSAKKVGLFYREAVRGVSRRLSETKGLKDYEEWKRWLSESKSEYGYAGYIDNWLHWEVEETDSEVIERIDLLGHKHKVFMTSIKHTICGKSWKEIRVSDLDQLPCGEICGYILDQ